MKAEIRQHTSEWLEELRNLSPEEKEEYLARKFQQGRQQAKGILGKHPKLNMTREEVREMFAREYPELTLSDQIIEDRRAGF